MVVPFSQSHGCTSRLPFLVYVGKNNTRDSTFGLYPETDHGRTVDSSVIFDTTAVYFHPGVRPD